MASSEPTKVTGLGLTIPPGTRLNGIFEIERQIGAGGMGMVYRAHNVETGDKVAIKIVRAEMAGNEQVIALFRKEAAVLHRLLHDAIVRYYLFTSDPAIGRPYLATEFVDGTPLSEIGRLDRDDVLKLASRLASGLQAAHDVAIFHRDISPDNVILPERDVAKAKIIDFGIARAAAVGGGTVIGDSIAGKFDYMSPEQLGLYGGQVDARSDIYSLGIVLAEAVLGRGLGMGGTQLEVIEKRRKVPDISAVEPRLRALLSQMLQPRPEDRIATMALVAETAREIASGGAKVGAGRLPRVAAAAAVVVLMGAGAWYFLSQAPAPTPDTAAAPPLVRQSASDSAPPLVATAPRTPSSPPSTSTDQPVAPVPDNAAAAPQGTASSPREPATGADAPTSPPQEDAATVAQASPAPAAATPDASQDTSSAPRADQPPTVAAAPEAPAADLAPQTPSTPPSPDASETADVGRDSGPSTAPSTGTASQGSEAGRESDSTDATETEVAALSPAPEPGANETTGTNPAPIAASSGSQETDAAPTPAAIPNSGANPTAVATDTPDASRETEAANDASPLTGAAPASPGDTATATTSTVEAPAEAGAADAATEAATQQAAPPSTAEARPNGDTATPSAIAPPEDAPVVADDAGSAGVEAPIPSSATELIPGVDTAPEDRRDAPAATQGETEVAGPSSAPQANTPSAPDDSHEAAETAANAESGAPLNTGATTPAQVERTGQVASLSPEIAPGPATAPTQSAPTTAPPAPVDAPSQGAVEPPPAESNPGNTSDGTVPAAESADEAAPSAGGIAAPTVSQEQSPALDAAPQSARPNADADAEVTTQVAAPVTATESEETASPGGNAQTGSASGQSSDGASFETAMLTPEVAPPVIETEEPPISRVAAFVRDAALGPCAFAAVTREGPGSAAIVAYGNEVPPFEQLDSTFHETFGFSADINLRPVADAQCPAVELVAALAGGPSLGMSLGNDIIRPGGLLSGRIEGAAGRTLHLYLIAGDGHVYGLADMLEKAGNGATFATQMDGTSDGPPQHLLLAVAADSLPNLAAGANGAAALDTLREALADDPTASAALGYFKYGP